jgi:hypothetical protein
MTSATTAPVPGQAPAQLDAKTLKQRQRRTDRLLAWTFAFLLLAVVVGLWAASKFYFDTSTGTGGDTPIGYALGGITALLYGVVTLYSWRRGKRRQRRAMLRVWMEIHLALGLVAGVAATLHSGPQFGAPMHGAFLVFWLALIATGILGKFLYSWIPKRLALLEEESLLMEDVVERRTAVQTQMDELLDGADPQLAAFADKVVPKAIKPVATYAKARKTWDGIIDEVFEQVKGAPGVAGNEDVAERLVRCRVEEAFYNKQFKYQMALRIWLPAHVGLTTLCVPWLAFHVVTVFLF